MKRTNKGFTIVELAVVLVIIGLLVGAILAGQNVIENAKRMALISDFSDHKSAYDQFKGQYYGMPGDLSNAEDYFGAANTNNGDGDGDIDTTTEDLLAWQHLGLSGYIDGTFSGTTTGASSTALLDDDMPSAPQSGAGYRMLTASTGVLVAQPSVQVGRFNTGKLYNNPVLAPQDASSIDTKIDNGNPSMGQVISADGNGSSAGDCVDTNAAGDTDDEYNLLNAEVDCMMIYYIEEVQD